jgi:2-succinyl-6-hydroxy-2,4-cyclohexadiene-1-carboxylate synthase
MGLYVEREGPEDGPEIVLVHGFAQNRECLGPIVPLLARRFSVLKADAPGHGRSSEIVASMDDGASYLAEACGRAIYLGYSMGGRLCLHLALQHPELVRALILVSATPGIEDDDARARRRAEDEQLAARIEAIGLEAFVDEWLSRPMFQGLEPDARMRAARLRNDPRALASALRVAGAGAQRPLWERLGSLSMPVLLVTGERDAPYSAIGDRMAALIPSARRVTISDAGHAAHLEAPDAFFRALDAWLKETAALGL